MLKKKLKVALHLVHSNSFCNKKSLHICKLDHRWRTTLIKKKQVRLAKNGVSQEYIGPPILEKIQMYILTRAEILYTLCYEIPCSALLTTQQVYPTFIFELVHQDLLSGWVQAKAGCSWQAKIDGDVRCKNWMTLVIVPVRDIHIECSKQFK